MHFTWMAIVWIAFCFSASDTASAFPRIQVGAGAGVNLGGPHPDVTCFIGGGSTQCTTLSPEVSTGIYNPPNFGAFFGASSADLPTARVTGFVRVGAYPQGSGLFGANSYAMFDDNVTMHLAPGATWPQTFVVRAYVRGTVTPESYNSSYAEVKFQSVIDEVHWWSDDVDVTYEQSKTISATSTFAVRARLDLNHGGFPGGLVDFGTEVDRGVRIEVDLPPGLTMTSDSGVLMTERPQTPGVVLPDPLLPGPPVFRFPGAGSSGSPSRRSFDPPIVTGYEYEIPSGGFALVSLPVGIGDDLYDLYVFDPDLEAFVFVQSLAGGVTHYFEGIVTRFQVRDIEPGAGLDPNDPTAFVTDLAFLADEPVEMTMTPLTVETEIPAVPWPILFGVGAALVIAARRRLSRPLRAG